MSSVNIALSIFSDTHVSVFTFSSAITLSLLLLLLSVILGESDHVSYMIDKSSCSIYKFNSCLGHLFVVLTVQLLNSMSDLYPDPIIFVSIITCVSIITWRIYCLPYHSMVTHRHFLTTKT